MKILVLVSVAVFLVVLGYLYIPRSDFPPDNLWFECDNRNDRGMFSCEQSHLIKNSDNEWECVSTLVGDYEDCNGHNFMEGCGRCFCFDNIPYIEYYVCDDNKACTLDICDWRFGDSPICYNKKATDETPCGEDLSGGCFSGLCVMPGGRVYINDSYSKMTKYSVPVGLMMDPPE